MLQLRHGNSGKVYRTDRDLIQLYPNVVLHAVQRLTQDRWHKAVREFAEHEGLTEAHLVQAGQCLVRFIELTPHPACREVGDAWVNSGLAALPSAALMALMFQVGAGFTSSFFNSVREAVREATTAPGLDAVAGVVDLMGHTVSGPSKAAQHRRAADVTAVVAEADLAAREP